MQVTEIPMELLREAPWNPNQQDPAMLGRLKESISRYGLVQNLVARPLGVGAYEVLSGNQRLQVLRDQQIEEVPCVVVELDDSRARLLAQALNRVHGEDDLGLRAELVLLPNSDAERVRRFIVLQVSVARRQHELVDSFSVDGSSSFELGFRAGYH